MADELKAIEDELNRQQRIDVRLNGDDNAVQKVVDKMAVDPVIYVSSSAIKKVIDELSEIIQGIAEAGGIRGKLLGEKAINRFFEDTERRQLTAKQLRATNALNAKQAARRADLYYMQLQKEAGILQADIEIFKANARIAGFNNHEIVRQLVRAGGDKAGLAQGFAKRAKSISVAAQRREMQARKIETYRDVTPPKTLWQWIAISVKPCPDCDIRAGRVLTLAEWEEMGLPGSGRTICGAFCRCDLYPMPVADELFPEVKTFAYNKGDGVLTTASEARKIRAKKATPPQKKG